MSTVRLLPSALAALVFGPFAFANAQPSLASSAAYWHDFEAPLSADYLAEATGWRPQHVDDLRLSTRAHTGAQAVEVPGGGLPSFFTPPSGETSGAIRWVDCYYLPAPFAREEVPAALKRLVGNGWVVSFADSLAPGSSPERLALRVWALDASGRPVSATLESRAVAGGGITDPWLRFTARVDTSRETWDLYVDGRLVLVDLPWASAREAVSPLTFTSPYAHSSYLDDFYCGPENPLFPDPHQVGIPADWLDTHRLVAYPTARTADPDKDGWDNRMEYLRGTSPILADSDDDDVNDSAELALGTNPLARDTDGDGIHDGTELLLKLDPTHPERLVAGLVLDATGTHVWKTAFSLDEGFVPAPLDGQNGWRAQGGARIHEGQLRLEAHPNADAVATRLFAEAKLDRIFVEFRARFVPGRVPSVADAGEAGGSALFGFRSPRIVTYYDRSTARWLDRELDLSADQWNHYLVALDYPSRSWYLVVNGRVASPRLPFVTDDFEALSALRFMQAASPLLSGLASACDDIQISNREPPDADFDGDRIPNHEEALYGSDSLLLDSDHDQLPDAWELQFSLDPTNPADALSDPDHDGIVNRQEYALGTHPRLPDPATPGVLTVEQWDGLPGAKLPRLTDHPSFPTLPSRRFTLPQTETRDYRGDAFGLRLRGYLLPPVSGDYLFWVAGDEETALWLSPTESPFDRVKTAWNSEAVRFRFFQTLPSQSSLPIRLEAGKRYYFELLSKEHLGHDFFSLFWRIPGRARSAIDQSHVASFARLPADLDDDGLPDAWEIRSGLDARLGHAAEGAHGDPDLDGLTNLEEYRFGADPHRSRSLLSSETDYDAVYRSGLHLGKDLFDARPTPVLTVPPVSATLTAGDWQSKEGGLDARSLRGSLTYPLHLAEAGFFRLDLSVADAIASNPAREFDVELRLDGRFLARLAISASGQVVGMGKVYLPWLSAGAHRLEMTWHNGRSDSFLRITGLALVNPGLGDADKNGVADWADASLAASLAWTRAPSSSAISPCTLEGRAPYPEFLTARSSVEASSSISELRVQESLTGNFYVNAPLSPDSATRVAVSAGAGGHDLVREITWTPLDLRAAGTPSLRARVADTLLITVGGYEDEPLLLPAIVSVLAPGGRQETFTLARGERRPVPFPRPGTYEFWLKGTEEDGKADAVLALSVRVEQVDLAPLPLFISGGFREWSPARLGPDVWLEKDRELFLEERLPATLPRLFFTSQVTGRPARLVARLGEDGPLAAAGSTLSLRSQHTEPDKWQVVSVLADGTQLWRGVIDLGQAVPAGLRVEVDIFKAGTTFLDGTLTRTFTAADFDARGIAEYYILRAPDTLGAPCHMLHFFDGEANTGFSY